MGYRSDVSVVIYPDERNQEKYDMLKVLMGTTFKDTVALFDANMEWRDEGCALIFNIVDVKWYDSYTDVQAFLHMLNVLANEVKEGGIEGYNYEMVRLGEESDDIEFTEGGEYTAGVICVSRVVDINI
jgi:hypothetical protein